MASFLSWCFATTCLILSITYFAPLALTEDFTVGDTHGWHPLAPNETDMYVRWAANLRIHVGDSLRFVYKNDSVQVVDKWGYYHCNSTHPISIFRDGNTVINLEKPGSIYFASADLINCKNGERLMVEIMSLNPISPDALSPSSSSESKTFSVLSEMVLLLYVLLVSM